LLNGASQVPSGIKPKTVVNTIWRLTPLKWNALKNHIKINIAELVINNPFITGGKN
jgi:hypothetical protein